MIFFVILPADIMITIITSAILAGLALSLVGTFVVHMKITSVGFCMSHTAFAGAALGILIQAYGSIFNPVYMAIIFTILVAFLLGPLSDKTKLDSNIILGILFSLMIALGFIFISQLPEGVTGRTSMTIIWGSLFGLNKEELIMLIILNLFIIIIIILFYKELTSIMLNQKIALTSGINVSFFKFVILFATAIAVSFSINIVGAFLVYAMIVNPTSTAYQFIYDTKKLFILSPIIGVLTILGGVYLSLWMNFPISSSIIIFSSIVFVVSVLFSPKHRKAKNKKKETYSNERCIENVRNYFNEHAKNWDDEVYHDPEKLRIIINALKLKQGSKVLDVGTGTGITIPYLVKHVTNNGKVVAVDISKEMITISKNKYSKEYPNVDFIVGDINEISYENNFDTILCYSCFPHFLDQENIINKMVRALNQSGTLMIAHSQSRKNINSIHKNVQNITSKDRLPPMRILKNMLLKSNLKIIESLDNREMFYVIAKKNS